MEEKNRLANKIQIYLAKSSMQKKKKNRVGGGEVLLRFATEHFGRGSMEVLEERADLVVLEH